MLYIYILIRCNNVDINQNRTVKGRIGHIGHTIHIKEIEVWAGHIGHVGHAIYQAQLIPVR